MPIHALTRRRLLQHSALLAAAAGIAPLLAGNAWAASGLVSRKIPSSGASLPIIGLGTSQTFNVSLAPDELKPLLEVLKVMVAGGAQVIDTAPSYGNAEAVSGELVKQSGSRDKVFLATKVSATGRDAGMAQIERSFKALQTDTIDLIQVHNLQDTTTQLANLRELKARGRIRYIGVTHYREAAQDDLLAVLQKEKVDFVQVNLSVGARYAEKRLLPWCADNGVAVLINRAFQAGDLFAQVKGKAVPEWLAEELEITSWAQAMLKFVLGAKGVTTVIPATSNPHYAADNLLAGQGRMPDAAQRERIAALFVG